MHCHRARDADPDMLKAVHICYLDRKNKRVQRDLAKAKFNKPTEQQSFWEAMVKACYRQRVVGHGYISQVSGHLALPSAGSTCGSGHLAPPGTRGSALTEHAQNPR